MSEETFLQRAKRERDEADTKLIQALLATIPAKGQEAVMQRKAELRVSVEKTHTDILYMGTSPAKDLFYTEMEKLGFPRHTIKVEAYSERPPYTYTIVLNLDG